MSTAALAVWAFVVSTIFAMGGVGSAIVLVPSMEWMGIPFLIAKTTGLFTNTLAMLSSTLKNIRHGKLDYRFSLPIVITSMAGGALGAYSSRFFPKTAVMIVFAVFLLYSGTVLMFFHPKRGRTNGGITGGAAIGALAGFLGGLLGVGGGAVLSPSLIMLGHEPKKVATTTAVVVFFSSFVSFMMYSGMGGFNVNLALLVALPALAGGWIGSHLMHTRLSSRDVKRLLGGVIYLMAAKILLSIAGVL